MKLYAFQGYRYNSARLDAAPQAAPPFDQIDEALRDRLHAQSPHQFSRVTKPVARDGETPHEHSAALHREWLGNGVVERDETPSLYPYAITQPDGSSRLGLCALVGVEPGRERDLWPHEQTVAKSIAERLALLRLTQIDIEPVFYLAEDDGTLERLLSEDCSGAAGDALVRHTDPWTGDIHSLFRITERRDAQGCPRRDRRRPPPHPGRPDLRRRGGGKGRHRRGLQDGRPHQPGLREPADRPGPPRHPRPGRPRGDVRVAGAPRDPGSDRRQGHRRPRRCRDATRPRRLVPGRSVARTVDPRRPGRARRHARPQGRPAGLPAPPPPAEDRRRADRVRHRRQHRLRSRPGRHHRPA
ncbi:MAG: DUF1015 family protein [Acidobacteria bacterium]|nr:DUF1015 family protein [Acidobacteriota bacterium]